MSERDLISFISGLQCDTSCPWLDIGIGDDCAVVDVEDDHHLVVTTDMLIVGTHCGPDTAPELIGRKAIARAMSDLAAMAASPLANLAAVSFPPDATELFCEELCRALWESADRFGGPLIGGDVSSGTTALTVTVTSLGLVQDGEAVARAGAREGDAICVTGALGGSLRGRHLRFSPRIREARKLVDRYSVHAMIDVSDGLSTDLGHICDCSGVGATLEADSIPVHEDLQEELEGTGAKNRDYVRRALNDGEDYELLFCVDENSARQVQNSGLGEVRVTIIGQVRSQRGMQLHWSDGRYEKLEEGGWEHLNE